MESLTGALDTSDPGDETLRKFRYQHAYGVILLIGILTEKLDYVAIWCEQQEDYLAELPNGQFDAIQVKTREPEYGKWEIKSEAFVKSFKRFVHLDTSFPHQVRRFIFVSNAECSNSGSAQREHLSPIKLTEAVKLVKSHIDLTESARKGFDLLVKTIPAKPDALFAVLKRTHLILGPTDRAFEAEICQSHLPSVSECIHSNPLRLLQLCEALIARVAEASALVSNDPSRHLPDERFSQEKSPFLLAKRISADEVLLIIRENREMGFRFLPGLSALEHGIAADKSNVLRRKMLKGGLEYYFEAMLRRAVSAEQELLDLVTRPDKGRAAYSQIESVVLTQCSDAHLRASESPEPFGTRMLIDVQDRLMAIAESKPAEVHQQTYDLLMGVSGLLTAACLVWWSHRFDVDTSL